MTAPVPDFSLVRDDLPIRLQRRIGLAPRDGLGVVRRAVFFGLVAWLPLAIWAWLEGRFLPGHIPEPFIQHFGIHARCLVAIPLLIVCEATAQNVGRGLIRHLLDTGIVTDVDRPRLATLLVSLARLRDSSVPWVIVAGVGIAWPLAGPTLGHYHELLFATAELDEPQRLTFGAWWFLYVSRAIVVVLLMMWLWRLVLWTIALARIARLDLALVPTHADRVFGLSKLTRTPTAFWPLLFGLSVVLAATSAHDIVYHGVNQKTVIVPLAVFAAAMLLIMLAPLLAFMPVMARAKRAALAEYGSLVARHGRLVHGKWILGRDPGAAPLLDAPELGPVADVVSLYQAVASQRIAPITKATLAMILIPLLLPMLAVIALQVPLGDLLLNVLKKLI